MRSATKGKFVRVIVLCHLPRWLRHSMHRPGRSIRGAGAQFPGSAGRFRVRISETHALRLISRAGKEGSMVSSYNL